VFDSLAVTAVVRRLKFPLAGVDSPERGVVAVDSFRADRVALVVGEPPERQGFAVDEQASESDRDTRSAESLCTSLGYSTASAICFRSAPERNPPSIDAWASLTTSLSSFAMRCVTHATHMPSTTVALAAAYLPQRIFSLTRHYHIVTRQTRRTWLAGIAAGTALLAGCSSGGDGGDANGDGGDANGDTTDGSGESTTDSPTAEPTTEAEAVADATEVVPGGEYYYWPFELEASHDYTYEFAVQAGPAVDVFTMPEEALRDYANEEEFEYLDAVSSLDSTGTSVQGTLEAGAYVLLVDNTSAGRATPPAEGGDGEAEVEMLGTVQPA